MADFHKVPVDLFNRIYDYIGTGDPTTPLPNAAVGSLYRKLDGVSGSTLWQKTASGWEALQGSSFTQATADARYVQLTGGTMSGTLTVPVLAISGAGNTLLHTITANTSSFWTISINSGAYISLFGADSSAVGFVGSYTSMPFTVRANNIEVARFLVGGGLVLTDTTQSPLRMTYPSGATDAKKWWLQNLSDGTFRVRAINDAESSGANALQFTRSGTTIGAMFWGGYSAPAGYSGPGVLVGDVVARRAATTGVYYFGDANTKYFYYDGTNFNLSGGALYLTGNLYTTNSYGSGVVGSLTGLYHNRESYMGYSAVYKVVILGDLQGTQRVLSLGVDVTANTSGSFNGDGSEIITPNITRFITPNAANTGYLSRLTFGSAGDLTITGATTIAGSVTGNEFYNASGAWFRSIGAAGWFNSTYSVGIYATASGVVRTYNNSAFHSEAYIDAATYIRASTWFYADQAYESGMIGLYDPTKFRLVYAMGDGYKIPAGGTALTGLYGMFYAYDYTSGYQNVTTKALGHGMGIASNGAVSVYLGTGIWTNGNAYASDFILV